MGEATPIWCLMWVGKPGHEYTILDSRVTDNPCLVWMLEMMSILVGVER
jgi:hypothetical protein